MMPGTPFPLTALFVAWVALAGTGAPAPGETGIDAAPANGRLARLLPDGWQHQVPAD